MRNERPFLMKYPINDQYNSNFKTRLTQDFYLEEAVGWMENFYPYQYGFSHCRAGELIFPNGFTSWQETHYRIVSAMSVSIFMKGTLTCVRHEDEGDRGLYDLAREMTNEFERDHEGVQWLGDFHYSIEHFIQIKNL